MVENQAAHNDPRFHAWKRSEEVAGSPMHLRVQSSGPFSKIQSCDSPGCCGQHPAQPSISGPEFDHPGVRIPPVIQNCLRNPTGTAQKRIQSAKIATAPQGFGMPRIQRVEDLGCDRAREAHLLQALYQGSRSLCVASTTRIPTLFRPFSGCDLSR